MRRKYIVLPTSDVLDSGQVTAGGVEGFQVLINLTLCSMQTYHHTYKSNQIKYGFLERIYNVCNALE